MAKKNKQSATRRIIWVIVGLVVLVAIIGVVGRATGVLGGGEDGLAVETAVVEQRDVTQVVTASGRVQPEVEVIMSPDVSGEIIALPVVEGDQVRQGQLLARIKPDYYAAQVEQAQAGVFQAKANLSQRRADMLKAKTELDRQQDLLDKNVISQSAFDLAKTQYDVAAAAFEGAEYAVQSAEARLRETQEQLSKTAVYAPMDGTISMLNVELGERVVGANMMTGTEMMRIARLDQMEIEVDVNENDVVNVTVGDTASIEVDAYPERLFKGVVTEIANSARVTAAGTQEQVTNFPVKVRVLDQHNLEAVSAAAAAAPALEEIPLSSADVPNFRPGMSGTVDIFTQTVFDAVAVPIQSVTVRDFNRIKADSAEAPPGEAALAAEGGGGEDAPAAEGGPAGVAREDLRKVVFLADDGEARMVEVETGISDETHIVVRTGLTGGETVITGPYRAVSRELEPGRAVKTGGGPRGPGAIVAAR